MASALPRPTTSGTIGHRAQHLVEERQVDLEAVLGPVGVVRLDGLAPLHQLPARGDVHGHVAEGRAPRFGQCSRPRRAPPPGGPVRPARPAATRPRHGASAR